MTNIITVIETSSTRSRTTRRAIDLIKSAKVNKDFSGAVEVAEICFTDGEVLFVKNFKDYILKG